MDVAVLKKENSKLKKEVESLKDNIDGLPKLTARLQRQSQASIQVAPPPQAQQAAPLFAAGPVTQEPPQYNTNSIAVGSTVPANMRASIIEGKLISFYDLIKHPEARHTHALLDVDLESGAAKKCSIPCGANQEVFVVL